MKLLMESWRYYLKESVPQRGPSGKPGLAGEPEESVQMTVRDLLGQNYDVAYIKDVDAREASPCDDNKSEVFNKVKEYQKYFEVNPDLSSLPPFQAKGSWLTDGAHRFNALRLASQNKPQLLDQIIQINIFSTKPHWQQHAGDGHWSKPLFENWRKFLNEKMDFGEAFEKWYHGEMPEGEDIDDEDFGEGHDCNPHEADADGVCLRDYGFEKIGEGSFREVWAFPDTSNYVIKTATGEFGDPERNAEMNKAEADAITQTGYPELVPKVYDTGDDYKWIVTERVKPYEDEDDSWIDHFFPVIKKFLEANRNNKEFHWRNASPERFFASYLDARKGEIRTGDELKILTRSLGGKENREALEADLPLLFDKLLDLVNEQQLVTTEIRSDNVGRASDGRFVLLDLGWGLDRSKETEQVIEVPPREYSRERK